MPDQPYRLEVGERGTLDSLQLRPAARRAPAVGEVEIEVQASGLNFRDLLNVLGMYPGDPGPLGAECAGKIAAVGPGVTRFAVGDEVLAMAPASFSQYVTASADYVIRKPAALSAVEAAALPSVFVTAYYGLHELARIKAGDRVPRSMRPPAVWVWRQYNWHRWLVLRSLRPPAQSNGTLGGAAGVTHLYNSRSVDFAAEILADTNGQGVDLILNSLTGPAILKPILLRGATAVT